jgi:hypothetical protein
MTQSGPPAGPAGGVLTRVPEADASVPDQSPSRPYDREQERDTVRGLLALLLVFLLIGVVLAAWVSLWFRLAPEPEIKDLLSVILPPVVALVGSAIGFYFGGKAAAK